jgi:hypothetical protein
MFVSIYSSRDSRAVIATPTDEHNAELWDPDVSPELNRSFGRLGKVAIAFFLNLSRLVVVGIEHILLLE